MLMQQVTLTFMVLATLAGISFMSLVFSLAHIPLLNDGPRVIYLLLLGLLPVVFLHRPQRNSYLLFAFTMSGVGPLIGIGLDYLSSVAHRYSFVVGRAASDGPPPTCFAILCYSMYLALGFWGTMIQARQATDVQIH